MVEKQVNDHAGDGDVQPHWEHQTGYLPVFIVLPLEAAPEGEKHEWGHGGSEDRVRCKDREIDRPNQSFAGKPGGAEAEIVSSERVVR